MNWQEKKASLTSHLEGLYKGFKISGEEPPEVLRKKQLLRLSIGGCIALVGASYVLGLFDFTESQPQEQFKKEPEKPIEQRMAELSTPLSAVKEGDIWVSRIEKLVKGSQEDLERIKSENVFLEKKINTLMGALGGNPDVQAKAVQELQALEIASKRRARVPMGVMDGRPPVHGQPPVSKTSVAEDPSRRGPSSASSGPQRFPAIGKIEDTGFTNANATSMSGASHKDMHVGDTRATNGRAKKRKLLHLSNATVSDHSNKSPETYLPAGTYFKVVTAMGVVVSTGTNSSSDPQPILLRIVDDGNLPGGLKGKVKDAVLIGTCYGSASAERAICRLKTLSWRDKSNRSIEKPVEGWISSEDGVQGIRAKIIDRSSEIAREAFGAGLLSAASNFFKMEATSNVSPMGPFGAPFGQTNAFSRKEALKGAAGTGVSSALDKLAEFSIKRAESMSPVAYVASGRVLDAVLMRGVDLSPLTQEKLSLVNSTSEPPYQPEPQGEKQ